jgi:hypothetical protein
MNKPDSILCFITGPSVSFWFMHSVFNLFKDDHDQRFAADQMLVFGPYIHQNRNRLADQFLKTDREWMFMVDNDMVFNPEDVWLLFEEADEGGPGVYAAAYMIENGVLVCGPWDNEIPMVYHPMVGLPKSPTEVGVVGAGFTLVHRDVFEAIGESWFSPISEEAGEDVSFSWRARETGYTPVLVPASNPGHFKQVALYPHEQVRNMVGDEVNLVETEPRPALERS